MADVVIILLLVLVNGVLSMTELAVFSSRRTRLQQLAADGSHGARAALGILDHPTAFLSTVQVGITLVAILTGAIGEATLVDELAEVILRIPLLAPYAHFLAFAVLVTGITYVSVTFGEIVPKRIALRHAESLACFLAPPMQFFALVGYPAVWLLTASTDAVLRFLGIPKVHTVKVSAEDIKILVDEGAYHGGVQSSERELVKSALELHERPVNTLMTPRSDLVWLDLDDPEAENFKKVAESKFRRYPVARGNLDHLVGIFDTRELAARCVMGHKPSIKDCLVQPLLIPESTTGLQLLEKLKASPIHVAIVADEHGGIEGMITYSDALSALVGDLPGVTPDDPVAVPRQDGSWLVDGYIGIAEFRRALRLSSFDENPKGDYSTLAGFVMAELGRIPKIGDTLEADELHFEIVDMDRHRVDKLLVTRLSRRNQVDSEGTNESHRTD